jgi:hypothetical protein
VRRAHIKAGESAWAFVLALAFADSPATLQSTIEDWSKARQGALDIVRAHVEAIPRDIREHIISRDRERQARKSLHVPPLQTGEG